MATVEALNTTHFLLDGQPFPRHYVVRPMGTGAQILGVGTGAYFVIPLGSTVAGATPSDQAALISALAAIVMAAGGGAGGATAAEIGDNLRGGAALPVAFSSSATVTVDGTPTPLPASVTLASGTERVVLMGGASVPRSFSIEPVAGDTVRIRHQYAAGGEWFTEASFTTADSADVRQIRLTSPVYAVGITRTAGSGTTSVVRIA